MKRQTALPVFSAQPPHVAKRQFVFSIPKALRVFFRHDKKLFGPISSLIFSMISEFHTLAAGTLSSWRADSIPTAASSFSRSTTLLHWKHSGFSVNNSVRIGAEDHKARIALAQYIARPPLPHMAKPEIGWAVAY